MIMEGEDNVIAAAKHILMALGSNGDLTKDARKVLSEFGARLSSMSLTDQDPVDGAGGLGEIQEKLNLVQGKIMSWESDESMIWDSGPGESFEYLMAAEEAQRLTVRLEQLGFSNEEDRGLSQKAHDVLQTAMARLEEEFKHILIQHSQPFVPGHVSFRSTDQDDIADEDSFVSLGDESVEDSIHRDSMSRTVSEDMIVDLVHPDVISDLRSIANLMFMSNYDHECSQAYIAARKDALEEFLFNLEMEKLSMEDVLKMDWSCLISKIKRWIWAMKVFIRIYLTSEKSLSDQVFSPLGSTSAVCFVEASKSSMLQLLQFAHAMSIGHHGPEKLMRILDMYEVLAELLPDIDALFLNEAGSSVRNEYHEVLSRLGDSIRVTASEFKDAIASNTSSSPFPGGGVHPMTNYVMNYIRLLTDYSGTLNVLFKVKDEGRNDSLSLSPETGLAAKEECMSYSGSSSPMALLFLSITTNLEANLEDRSKLYKDASLRHLFLMNNFYYMAQKVKFSELRAVFGDKWIRNHNWKFQKHELELKRATWHSILPLLKDEGASSLSRTDLKERLQSFYTAFEEVYKTQTAWVISDGQLREDVLISTSQMVIQAYRPFVGRHNHQIFEKHIKYSSDDLQNYLLNLFGGSQKSLPGSGRR